MLRYELQVGTAYPWRRQTTQSCTRSRRRLRSAELHDGHASDLLMSPASGQVGEWTMVRSPFGR